MGRHIIVVGALSLALPTTALLTASADTSGTAQPQPGVEVGEPWTIHENVSQPPEPAFAGFPGIFDAGDIDASGHRTHDYFVSYNAGFDVIGDIVLQHLRSSDGVTFTEYSADPELDVHNAVRLTNTGRDLIAPGYEPIFDNDEPPFEDVDNERQFPLFRFDDGDWVRQDVPATVTTDQPVAVARLHQGIATLPDGRLVAPLYGWTADERSYIYVVASDDGVTWEQIGTVAATGPAGRWTEASLVHLPSGGLAAAVRYQNPQTGRLDLYITRSSTTDGSGLWPEPTPVAQSAGAAPRFQQLANGALAVVSGRLDNQLRVSFDGLGGDWTAGETLYANYPAGVADDAPERTLGSSGYMGVVATGPDDLLILGDNCAGHWGCSDSIDEFTQGTQKTLWATEVHVDRGLGRRLDLLQGFRSGSVGFVDTQPVAYAKGQPSLLPYAFDGDTSPASSLVTADRTVTLDLGKPRPLAALVVHASLVGPEPLRVLWSVDGRRWAPVRATATGATHVLDHPVPARHLRLIDPNESTTATADWSFLDELQVYTTDTHR